MKKNVAVAPKASIRYYELRLILPWVLIILEHLCIFNVREYT